MEGINGISGDSISSNVLAEDRAKDLLMIGSGMGFHSRVRALDGKPQHIMPMNNDRAMYEYLRSIYPKEVLITDGFLRSSVLPTSGSTNFTFVVTKNDSGVQNISTNNLLDQSDTFETLYFRMGIYRLPTSLPGNGILSAGINHSQAVPQYFVNPRVFTEAAEQRGLQALYNGFLYVKIGTIVYYEQFEAKKFKSVGNSQQGVAVSTVPTAGVIGETSEHKEPKALVTPVVMINGSGKNVLTLNTFDPDVYQPTVANFTNFLCFECIGFKCQMGAEQPTMKFKFGSAAAKM